MIMLSGRILYAVHNGTYVIKFVGDVRVPLCASLEGFLERMFDDVELQAVLIDLSDTVAIDSTALGLIAKIAVFLRERRGKKPVILSTNPDVNRILNSMGFDRVFLILERAPGADGKLDELPLNEPSQEELTRHVIDAHRVLMSLNEKNKATFHDLVEALECEQSDKG
jgi:anti-anti-sigma factor